MRFEGKVVLVTGASGGIGRATALAFGGEGASVVLNHLGAEMNAMALGAEIREAGGEALVIEADVADRVAVGEMVQRATATYGGIDILINNAAVVSRYPMHKLEHDEWDRILNVNLHGVFNVCRAIVPLMLERGAGKIINLASELAMVGEIELAHYCASKAGVIGLTKALALELGPAGICVNVVAPGKTLTPMLMATPANLTPESLEAIPLRRLAKPDEIAATICFLASSEADYYTGAVLSPNGGTVMC